MWRGRKNLKMPTLCLELRTGPGTPIAPRGTHLGHEQSAAHVEHFRTDDLTCTVTDTRNIITTQNQGQQGAPSELEGRSTRALRPPWRGRSFQSKDHLHETGGCGAASRPEDGCRMWGAGPPGLSALGHSAGKAGKLRVWALLPKGQQKCAFHGPSVRVSRPCFLPLPRPAQESLGVWERCLTPFCFCRAFFP